MSEFFFVAGGFVLGAATAMGVIYHQTRAYLRKEGWVLTPGSRWYDWGTWTPPRDVE